MDPRADDDTALPDMTERERHQVARRREQDRGVEFLRRAVCGVAGPHHAERPGERLRLRVAGAGQCMHHPALVDGDLAHDVRRRAEPVQPES